jgi:dihydroorotate dehydrogenase (NAD+) catalytic subunit
VEPRRAGDLGLIVYRTARSFAWNAAHPPKLPARPRKLPPALPITLFDRRLASPIGIAAGPLSSSRWIEAYARLAYGILTYKTVRSSAQAALPAPNLVACHFGETAVSIPRPPRRVDPAPLTLAVSLGLPSAAPEAWRADVKRARARMGADQLLIVSVAGTAVPGGDGDRLAEDYATCARWAADAGADAVELYLGAPSTAAERAPLVLEDRELAGHIVERARRATGGRPLLAKLGALPGPRALHELATRLAPWLDGFVLVGGLPRKVVKPDGTPAFPGPGREVAEVVGADTHDACRVQVEELIAWRKAGAWDRRILAGGGITTTGRARAVLDAGASAALVATAALADPLLAVRFRQGV